MSFPFRTSALVLALGLGLAAQTPAPGLSLPQAVARAVAGYPAVLAALHQTEQAQALLDRQRAASLPDLQLVAQLDRATDNNTPGLLIGNGLPTISGPVAARYSWAGFTTSSAGAVFSWEVYDFGRRAAGVNFYQALASSSTPAISFIPAR